MIEDGRKYQVGQTVVVMMPVRFVVDEVYFSSDAESDTHNNFQYRLSKDVVVAEGDILSVVDNA